MAKPTCTFCGEYEGVLMDTNLDDGETQVVCANDILMYVLGMAAALTSGMTREQADAYAPSLDAIYANDPRGPKPPAPPKRSKRTAGVSDPLPPDGPQVDGDGLIALLTPCPQCGGKTAVGDADKLSCADCEAVLATADDASV